MKIDKSFPFSTRWIVLPALIGMFLVHAQVMTMAQDSSQTPSQQQTTKSSFETTGRKTLTTFDDQPDELEFFWSPDGKRYAFITGGMFKNTLVVDGNTVNEVNGRINRFRWGPQSQHYRYRVVSMDPFQRIQHTDNHRSEFSSMAMGSFTWGSDGKHFFYVGITEQDKSAMVQDGTVIDVVDDVEEWVPYRDTFLVSAEENGQEFLYFGEKRMGPFQNIGPMKVSEHQEHALIAVEGKDAAYYVYDGEKFGPYRRSGLGRYALSPHGNHWFGTGHKPDSSGTGLISDGDTYGPFESLGPIRFSPDGKHLAFIDQDHQEPDRLYVDGKLMETSKTLSGFTYAADGSGLIYSERDGGEMNVKGARTDTGPYDRIVAIDVHPNGSTWGYIAEKDEKFYAVIDGEEHGPYMYAAVRLHFSPEGNRFYFYARDVNSDAELLVVDGRACSYDGSLTPVKFYVDNATASYSWALFDQSGNHFWYITENRQQAKQDIFIYQNGSKWITADKLLNVRVSTGQKLVGFRYKIGQKRHLNIDGNEFKGTDITGLTYSDNEEHYAVRVKKRNRKDKVVVDGQTLITSHTVFNPTFVGNKLVVAVLEGNKLIRYEFDKTD